VRQILLAALFAAQLGAASTPGAASPPEYSIQAIRLADSPANASFKFFSVLLPFKFTALTPSH